MALGPVGPRWVHAGGRAISCVPALGPSIGSRKSSYHWLQEILLFGVSRTVRFPSPSLRRWLGRLLVARNRAGFDLRGDAFMEQLKVKTVFLIRTPCTLMNYRKDLKANARAIHVAK